MIRSVAFLYLAAALASPAAALAHPTAASPVEPAFGNTIVSTYPDARTAELWLKSDGTYTAKGRRGDPSRGRWNVQGGRLCLRQARPIPMLFSFCTPIPNTGMGRPWPAKAATGEAISVRVVAGHNSGGG